MGGNATFRTRGALVGVMAVVVALVAAFGVARSEPAGAGLARVSAVVCLDVDLSVSISVDAAALLEIGDGVHHDHIAAAVRFRTDVGVVTDWTALPDSAARRFDDANGNHFDDTLIITPVTAAVALQVRLDAVGAWSDGTLGGILELPWSPITGCTTTPAPDPADGLLDVDATVDVDADLDVDGVIDLDADVDAEVDLDLGTPSGGLPQLPVPVPTAPQLPVPVPTVPSLPVPTAPTVPSVPTIPAVPTVPSMPDVDLDLDLDADVDIDLDLGLLPAIPVGGPITAPPAPPIPTDPSLIGIAARVRCGIGLDADVDLVLAGRPTATSHIVVTHPDSLLTVDVDLAAHTLQVVPLVDVLLGHRVVNVLVDGVSVDVAIDLSCPIDLGVLLTPTCVALADGLHIHLASQVDVVLALLLGVEVLDPVTGATVTAALDAGAEVDLWLAGHDGTLLEVRVQLLGIDLAVGVLTCSTPSVTPTTTTPTSTPPTTTPVTTPHSPTSPTTVPTSPTTTPTPTTATPGPAVLASQGSTGPVAVAPAALGMQTPVATTTASGSLPITGASSLALAAAAAALVAAGLAVLAIARRREATARR